jgi:hypothetical protein
MASDRTKAKGDVAAGSEETSEPAALSNAIAAAHSLKHELAKKKEENRHAEIMKDKEIEAATNSENRELGRFGQYLGGASSSPIAIAAITVFAGLFFVIYCFHAGAHSAQPEGWFHEAEWGGTLAATSLSFIFGRAGKK